MSNRFIDHGVVINGNYRHFKGNTYTVFGIATNTETEQLEVIYGNDGNRLWARPLEMFTSEVDHERYPNADQKMRLEYIPSISDERKAKVYDDYIKRNGPMYGMDEFYVVDVEGYDPYILSKHGSGDGMHIPVTHPYHEGVELYVWENDTKKRNKAVVHTDDEMEIIIPLLKYLL